MSTSTALEGAPSKAMWWAGVVLSALPGLMLLLTAVLKFKPPDEKALEMLSAIGWTPEKVKVLAIIEMACAVLYLIPQTATIGAILVTGYMGGAIATHFRIGDPFVMQALIPIVAWLGLYLREPRLRALIPWRT